jgi:hypothetical protein
MNSNDELREIRQGHPVHLRQVVYPTRASEELLNLCEAAVLSRCKGLVILAKPLMGLTTAIRMVSDGWRTLHPEVPMVTVRSMTVTKFDLRNFWASLATQISPTLAQGRDPDALRLRLRRNFASQSLARKTDRLLLLIDRAHSLLSEELSQVATFQDDLVDDGIHLVVVLAGYESLLVIRDGLFDEARVEPIRRYFEREGRFYGIRDKDDLKYLLESFDKARFPISSEWPISRFYFRDAFDRGWRLWHEASHAWSVLAGLAATDGERIEVEMQYVTESICSLLESAFEQGFNALPPDDDAWRKAVESSGLIQSRMLTSQLQKRKQKGRTGL